MKTSRKIILLIDRSREYGRGLVRGVAKYSRLHGPWTFFMGPESYIKAKSSDSLAWIKKIDADGIIMYDNPYAIKLIKTGLPVVLADSLRSYKSPNVVTIASDAIVVGEKGAQHLINRGFKSLAYCGMGDIRWSKQRSKGFLKRAKEKGISVKFFLGPWSSSYTLGDKENKEFGEWVDSLPKPIGIMCCNDDLGRKVIDTCISKGYKIPADIAVLGVDNDKLVCELCNPPLSSIPLNTEKAGYEAAEFLDKRINSKKIKIKTIDVPYLDPVERASTDIIATDDKDVSEAIRFIRQNFTVPLQVLDVAEAIGINRRTLERKFRHIVGHGINDEIRRVRVRHITKMLTETNSTITEIALKMKFTGIDHIARYFKKEMGLSPMEYRKKYR